MPSSQDTETLFSLGLQIVALIVGGLLGWISTAIFFSLADPIEQVKEERLFLVYCIIGSLIAFGLHFPFIFFRVTLYLQLKGFKQVLLPLAIALVPWVGEIILLVSLLRDKSSRAFKVAAYATLISFCLAVIDVCVWTQVASLYSDVQRQRFHRRSASVVADRNRSQPIVDLEAQRRQSGHPENDAV